MWFLFGGGLFKRSLPEKRTAKHGLRDLSWVKEAATTCRTSVRWPGLAM